MAQNIDLASFTFDETKLIESITKTKQVFFSLKTQQLDNNKVITDYSKQINTLIKDQDLLQQSGQGNSEQFIKNDAALQILTKSQEVVIKANTELTLKLSDVTNELKQQDTALKGTATTASGTATPYKNLNEEMNRMKQEAKDLGAELIILEREGKKNTDEYANIEAQFKKSSSEANALNDEFKKLDGSVGDNNRTVGDYKDQIKSAFQDLNIFNGGLSGFLQRSQEAGGAGNLLKNSFTGITSGIGGMIKASLAFIATPIGAVIAGISLILTPLISYFTQTSEGINKVTAFTQPLISIFQSLLGVLQNVGKNLFEAFSNPRKTLEDLGNFVKQNLINRFTAFGVILEGILELDFKKVANGAIQAGTGVENATDKIKQSSITTAKFLEDAAKKGSEIAKLGREIKEAELAYQAAARKTGDEIDRNLLISKDTSKSFTEREVASRNIIALTKELGKAEEAIIDKKIKQLEIQMSLGSVTDDQKKQLQELLNNKEDAGDRGVEAEKEQIRVIAGARKEAQETQLKAIEDRKKAQEESRAKEISLLNDGLDFFIASEAKKNKTSLEQIDLILQTSKKRIEILDKEYAAGNISKAKYDTELLKIIDENAKEQSARLMAKGKSELDLFISQNVSKLNNAKFLTQELINEEEVRLSAIKEKNLKLLEEDKKTNQSLIDAKLLNGQELTNQEREYLTQKNNLNIEFDNLTKANQSNLDLQIKEQKATQLIADNEIKLINTQTQYEYDIADAEIKFETEIATLKDRLAKQEITKEQYRQLEVNAAKKKDQLIYESQLKQTQSTLGGLQQLGGGLEALFGKSKALSLAMAAINGAQAITSILAQYPKFDGGFAMAAALVTAGVTTAAQIAKISSEKFEFGGKLSASKGGMAKGNSHANGGIHGLINGQIPIEFEGGEAIINKRSTALYSGILSEINQAGGGVPFANGGVVGSSLSNVQNNITQSLNLNGLSESISKAVFDGAQKGTFNGSQKGISDLNTNNAIAEGANF